MITSFCVGFGATMAFMIATVMAVRGKWPCGNQRSSLSFKPFFQGSIGFDPDLHTCVLSERSGWLIATWATPVNGSMI